MANRKGFTILELLIVMVMLAVLASVITPQVLKSRTDETFLRKAQEEIEARLNAARWYYNDYGAWPGSAATLKAPVANSYNPAGTPYLSASVSEASPFGNDYAFTSDANTFSISVNVPPDLSTKLGSRLLSPVYTVLSATQTKVTTSVPKPGMELMLRNFQDIKYLNVVDPGSVVTKPTCYSGTSPLVYVMPSNFRGGTAGKAIIGVTSKAVDNGDGTWTVSADVKDIANTLYSDATAIKLLVISLCR